MLHGLHSVREYGDRETYDAQAGVHPPAGGRAMSCHRNGPRRVRGRLRRRRILQGAQGCGGDQRRVRPVRTPCRNVAHDRRGRVLDLQRQHDEALRQVPHTAEHLAGANGHDTGKPHERPGREVGREAAPRRFGVARLQPGERHAHPHDRRVDRPADGHPAHRSVRRRRRHPIHLPELRRRREPDRQAGLAGPSHRRLGGRATRASRGCARHGHRGHATSSSPITPAGATTAAPTTTPRCRT